MTGISVSVVKATPVARKLASQCVWVGLTKIH